MKRIICLFVFTACAMAGADLRRSISELTLRDGRTLKNVTIVSYASSAVMAKWEGGQGTIPYQQFPNEWRNEMEPMRPKSSLTRGQVPPPAVVVSTPETSGARATETIAPSIGIELEKIMAQQAMEIAALKISLEAIEKRLRGI